MKKLMIALGLSATAVATPGFESDAKADGRDNYLLTYPGTQCNGFGNAALGPDGAAQLVNWTSSSPVLVECPVQYDDGAGWVDQGAFVDVVGNVTCQLFHTQPNGAGWVWNPAGTLNKSGYTEIFWNSQYIGGQGATSIECKIPQWAKITQYRVQNIF